MIRAPLKIAPARPGISILIWKRKRIAAENRIPKGVRIYAIGDIHGRADLLKKLLVTIDLHFSFNPIGNTIRLFVGDYVDRGPQSKEVIECLIDHQKTFNTVFLKGNHESLLLDFLAQPDVLEAWSECGGLQTLISYGLAPTIKPGEREQIELSQAFARILPLDHLNFFKSLRNSFTLGHLFFAHAGVRPGIALKKQNEEDLLWIRNDFLYSEGDFGKTVVHGHSPVMNIDIRRNRINIDTGAYATGNLTCAIFEDDRVTSLHTGQASTR
jgi:serine/threonine protein phosphatase 1